MADFYQDNTGAWHLSNGTLLMDYDPTTGAYEETDGTWYTYQGVAVMNYDKSTGSYQENDGTWYDRNGNAIQDSSSLPSTTKKGSVIGDIVTQVIGSLTGKKSTATIKPAVYVPPVKTPTPTKSNSGVIIGLVLGVAAVSGIFIYMKKNKK
jgi:hypothetical protein